MQQPKYAKPNHTLSFAIALALWITNALLLGLAFIGFACEVGRMVNVTVPCPIAGVKQGGVAAAALLIALFLLRALLHISRALVIKWHRTCLTDTAPSPASPAGQLLVAAMVSTIAACLAYWLPVHSAVAGGTFAAAVVCVSLLLAAAVRKTREISS